MVASKPWGKSSSVYIMPWPACECFWREGMNKIEQLVKLAARIFEKYRYNKKNYSNNNGDEDDNYDNNHKSHNNHSNKNDNNDDDETQ